jgi:hypothetical protein
MNFVETLQEEALSNFDLGSFYHNWAKMIDESSPNGAIGDVIPEHAGGGMVRVFDRNLHSRMPLNHIHAFTPLEALPCVSPMAFLSKSTDSYPLPP